MRVLLGCEDQGCTHVKMLVNATARAIAMMLAMIWIVPELLVPRAEPVQACISFVNGGIAIGLLCTGLASQ